MASRSTLSLTTSAGKVYSDEQAEWLAAVAAYQHRTGKRYPTSREIFRLALALGYRQIAKPVKLPINHHHRAE